MTSFTKITDIRKGDKVRFWTPSGEYTVTEVDLETNQVRYGSCSWEFWTIGKSCAAEEIEMVKKAPRTPKHWPPQNGDIWKANDREWHTNTSRMSPDTGTWMYPSSFKRNVEDGTWTAELAYRKGDSL